jgi:hypothetical protein
MKKIVVLITGLVLLFGNAFAAKTLVPSITLKHGGSQTYPLPSTGGVYVGGFSTIMVYIDWATWTGGGLSIQPIFAQSPTDTGASYYACSWMDTVSVTAPYSTGTAGSFSIRFVNDGQYPAGYMFLRLRPWATADVTGFTAKVEMVK